MVEYFDRHGTKQSIHGKSINFGYKIWLIANSLTYGIQFIPHAGKDSQLNEYVDIKLGLGGVVDVCLAETMPSQKESRSNYFVFMNNFHYLGEKLIAAGRRVRTIE